MNYQPIGDRVLVRVKKAEQPKSGIILTEDAEEAKRLPLGEVVSLGDTTGRLFVGATVLFRDISGEKVPNEPDLLILKASEILAMVL